MARIKSTSVKLLVALLAVALCMSLNVVAFADNSGALSEESVLNSEIQPRTMMNKSKYVSTDSNILILVTYTYNDTNGDIVGLQGISFCPFPAGITNVTIANTLVQDTYILITVTFKNASGVYCSESAYCYNG